MRILTRSKAPDSSAAMLALEELVALLEAGLPPGQAWAAIGERHREEAFIAEVTAPQAVATSLRDRLHAAAKRQAQHPVAASTAIAWHVTDALGSSAVPVLDALLAAMRWSQDVELAREEALAQPRATLLTLATLPLVGYALAFGLGANPFRILFGSPLGYVLLAAGVVFTAVTVLVVSWVIRRSAQATVDGLGTGDAHRAALTLDITAAALAAGAPAEHCLMHLHRAATAHEAWHTQRSALATLLAHRTLGAAWADYAAPPATRHLVRALTFSETTGAPAAPLLRRAATTLRRDLTAHGRTTAASLGIKTIIPTALGGLPAFACLVIVPTLADLLAGVATA